VVAVADSIILRSDLGEVLQDLGAGLRADRLGDPVHALDSRERVPFGEIVTRRPG
jgi:hypothetical protein